MEQLDKISGVIYMLLLCILNGRTNLFNFCVCLCDPIPRR